MMPPQSSFVEAARLDGTVWLRVIGRGTVAVSSGFKSFIQTMLDEGEKRFIVDLLDCEIMDSTFMGTLASVALKILKLDGGEIEVINANDRNASLLGNLGLTQIFKVRHVGDPASPTAPDREQMESAAADADCKKEAKRAALSAHETLVELNSSNASRFRDVVDYLRESAKRDHS
ncbi:MAG: STAS domain-containing protein [Chthoniobacterales bacterium]